MSTFDSLGISGSGLLVHRKWLDAVSDNIANVNNVTSTDQDAFRERLIVAQAVDYGSGEGGVRVARAEYGSAEGRLVFEPDHPLADANGLVRMPNINLSDQMASLMMAQRAYQANASVADRAKTTYEAAIGIGK